MRSSRPEPLSAFRQELPYRELWPFARALAATEPGTAFLDSAARPTTRGAEGEPSSSRWPAVTRWWP